MSKRKYIKRRRFNLALLPIMGVLGIVPLIVHLYAFDSGLEEYAFYYNDKGDADFFLAWKLYIFTAIVFAMACVVIYKLYREGKKVRFEKLFIPLGVYAFLAFLSAIFSEYQPFPFTGSYEQFESVFALMGYAVTAYYAFLFVESEKDLKIVIIALTFSVVCMMLIAVSQAFFTDFYKTRLAAYMILPISKWSEVDDLIFNFEEGRVYMSLYNPNYVGSYVSFLFPLYVMLALNKWKFRWLLAPGCIAISVGLILELLGSQSRAGFVGVVMALLVLAIVMNRKLLKYSVPIVFALCVLITLVHKANADSDNYYINKILSIFDPQKADEPNFSNLSADGNLLHITYCRNVLNIEFDYESETGEYAFHLTDDAGTGIDVQSEDGEEGWVDVLDERFPKFKIRAVGLEMYNTAGYGVMIDGKEWYFMNSKEGVQVLSPGLKPATPYTSETFGPLEGYERIASGRGFIWGKTIPLLMDNFIIGSGADTFVLEFPNDDFRSTYYGGYLNTVITKPHNMYLQIGVQTGVLSLIAILAFYIWYFAMAISTYARLKKLDLFGLTGVGVLCGSAGYMVTQFINDSSITVAPIFWTMMGVGIAALFKSRSDLKAQLEEARVLKEQKQLAQAQGLDLSESQLGGIQSIVLSELGEQSSEASSDAHVKAQGNSSDTSDAQSEGSEDAQTGANTGSSTTVVSTSKKQYKRKKRR